MAHPKLRTKKPRHRELKTVPAGRTRNRLIRLSSLGIGRKAVHEVTGIDHRTIAKIKSGRTRYVRRETRDLIFAVSFDAHCDKALIDAKPTRNLIEKMITRDDMAFTRSEIARRLGAKRPPGYATLEIGQERITARTAMKVRKLFDDARGVSVFIPEVPERKPNKRAELKSLNEVSVIMPGRKRIA